MLKKIECIIQPFKLEEVKEAKNRQVSPAWNKESCQGALNNYLLFLRTFMED